MSEGCVDQETNALPECTNGEAFTSPEFLDHVEAWEGADGVDGGDDDLDCERIEVGDTLENSYAVVELLRLMLELVTSRCG